MHNFYYRPFVVGIGGFLTGEFTPQHWLWPGWVPLGKVTMLVGDCGVGKSLLTLDMAARVTQGRAFPGAADQQRQEARDRLKNADALPQVPPEVLPDVPPEVPPEIPPQVTPEATPKDIPGAEAEARVEVPPGVGDVLLLAGEDYPWETIAPRLAAMGADLMRVHYMTHVQNVLDNSRRWIDLTTDCDQLDMALSNHKKYPRPIRLIIIDPLHMFITARRNATVQTVIRRLSEIAWCHQAAVVLVTHFGKSGTRRNPTPGQLVRQTLGSVLIPAAARSVLMLVRDPNDPTDERRLLLPGKCNLAATRHALAMRITSAITPDPMSLVPPCVKLPPELCKQMVNLGLPTAAIAWEDQPVPLTALQANQPRPLGRSTKVVGAALAWLQDELASGPVPVTELAQRAQARGISRRTLRRAKQMLGVVAQKAGGAHGPNAGWLWRLPEAQAPCDAASRTWPKHSGHLRLAGSECG